jgi:hypothetical protein
VYVLLKYSMYLEKQYTCHWHIHLVVPTHNYHGVESAICACAPIVAVIGGCDDSLDDDLSEVRGITSMQQQCYYATLFFAASRCVVQYSRASIYRRPVQLEEKRRVLRDRRYPRYRNISVLAPSVWHPVSQKKGAALRDRRYRGRRYSEASL